MPIDFTTEDITHQIEVKFTPAAIPGAKKPYTLKTVHQPVLGIHEVASKGDVYNIQTDPGVIERGMIDGLKIMCYLAADGYLIKTPMFTMRVCVPGEYDGTETRPAEGIFPVARLRASTEFRNYLREKAKVGFCGIEQPPEIIGTALDETTALKNKAATIGGLLTIRGRALKIRTDTARADETGLFFDDGNGTLVKADVVAVNEPRTLKVIVPAGLQSGTAYTLLVRTLGAPKSSTSLLKEPREIRSAFTLTARA